MKEKQVLISDGCVGHRNFRSSILGTRLMMKKLVTFLGALAVVFAMGNAHATVLYSEDFESLADGNLAGTDGWFTSPGGGSNALNIGTAQDLSPATRAIINTSSTNLNYGRGSTLAPVLGDDPYVLEFDLGTVAATDSWFGFRNGGFSGGLAGASAGVWKVDFRGITAETVQFVSTISSGTPISVRLTLDVSTGPGTILGEFDDGSGFVTIGTGAYDLDIAIGGITQIGGYMSAGTAGIDVDNIVLSSVPIPEPSSMSLMALGMLLAFRRRR